MRQNVSHFLILIAEVSVRKAGYCWKELPGDRLGELVYADEPTEDTPQSAEDPFRTYDPFDKEPALFRIFAELDPLDALTGTGRRPNRRSDPQLLEFGQALCNFANKYGLPEVGGLPGFPGERSTGRTLAWAIVEMRLAIALWDAVSTKNRRAISSIAKRDRKAGWCVDFMGYEFTPIGRVAQQFMQAVQPDWKVPSRPDDEFALAMQILESLIGSRADPKIEFCQSRPGILTLRMRAETLLSAMWLQLAMAVVENKQYRQCDQCGKPFELQRQYRGRQSREDKRFCGTNCRVISYQRRRALAKRMREEGKHLRTIAKAVESDMQTVKGWVGEE